MMTRTSRIIAGVLALICVLTPALCGCSSVSHITVLPAEAKTNKSADAAPVLSLNQREAVLPVGDAILLVPVVIPADAKGEIKWTSSDEGVATVDDGGRVSGIARGKAVITACMNGVQTAKCAVTVKSSQVYNEDGSVKVQGVNISRSSMSLAVGKTALITASVYPSDAYNQKITFLNSNTRSVQLDDDGTVTAIAPGTSVITAVSEDGGLTATCSVRVVCYMTEMHLSAEYLSLEPGKTKRLVVQPIPSEATNIGVTWRSSNPNVATVDEYGVVTAIAVGTSVITAKGTESKYSAQCQLTVEYAPGYIPLNNFTVKQTEVSVAAGEDVKLLTTLYPANTSEPTLTFTTGNNKVAFVSRSGVVTGVKPGETVVTISGRDGAIVRRCKVTVVDTTVAHHLYINPTEARMKVGETMKPDIGISNYGVEGETLVWSSSTPTVATVDANGVVTAKSGGTAEIFATLSESGYTATCTVKVENVRVSGVKIDPGEVEIRPGDSYQLNAVLSPSDATVTAVVWTSSNEGVATVNRKGVVTGINNGRAVITVTTADGKKTATCTVSVSNTDIRQIVFPVKEFRMGKGDEHAVVYKILPENAAYSALSWQSSNQKVATVKDGLVTAVGDGTATITATSGNGVRATCVVTVSTVYAERISLKKSSLTLNVGASGQIDAIVYPVNTSNRSVTYKSGNPSIATVDKTGKVVGVAAGSTVIEIVSADGAVTVRCPIQVTK